MEMSEFSTVLFDFDGTVADTAADVWSSVRYGFDSCGLALDARFMADNRNLAMSVQDMVRLLYPDAPAELGLKVREFVNHHYRFENEYPATVMYPCIEPLLCRLKEAGIKTGILSNKGHYSLGRLLELKGWNVYFSCYRGTADKPGVKLDKTERLRDFLQEIAAEGRIAYIGDSAGDVVAAKENHLFSVGVLYGDGDPQLVMREMPDMLCRTPEELYSGFIGGR